MRIGLMGGTFRPIHYGHLMIAENAREQLHLDRVWFIPNNSSPFKVDQHTDDAFDRLNMLSLAIQDNPYFEINHIELTRSGISYTYQTLECLKESYPQEDFFFLMGGDSFASFGKWYHPEIICKHATLAVAIRDDLSLEQLREYEQLYHQFDARVCYLHTPNISVSSSDIRSRIQKNETVRYLLPDSVMKYIQTHHLYQDQPD